MSGPLISQPEWFWELVKDTRSQQMEGCTEDRAANRQGLWLDVAGEPKTYANPRPEETELNPYAAKTARYWSEVEREAS